MRLKGPVLDYCRLLAGLYCSCAKRASEYMMIVGALFFLSLVMKILLVIVGDAMRVFCTGAYTEGKFALLEPAYCGN